MLNGPVNNGLGNALTSKGLQLPEPMMTQLTDAFIHPQGSMCLHTSFWGSVAPNGFRVASFRSLV